ncbi:MAG TPA: glycosyl hydrolase, partial [Hyphomonas sp.]|nr:glycosyl hydrolase [Hyphomonas sp.]
WLQGFKPREDGIEKRPTLYDSSYRPKLMRDAVAAALKAAPTRA